LENYILPSDLERQIETSVEQTAVPEILPQAEPSVPNVPTTDISRQRAQAPTMVFFGAM
jgi:hypothetical protein